MLRKKALKRIQRNWSWGQLQRDSDRNEQQQREHNMTAELLTYGELGLGKYVVSWLQVSMKLGGICDGTVKCGYNPLKRDSLAGRRIPDLMHSADVLIQKDTKAVTSVQQMPVTQKISSVALVL
ncbi:uncharacterized protein LOC143267276 isoform X2 [Peromyscus maniculatus bairdii]|uniref:uncharacterized protein LOC143267276 isoform X2 n=2 Tax=Peromyscus maniculatus bairdii TaxID=230844 RepID=UPI003FD5DE74